VWIIRVSEVVMLTKPVTFGSTELRRLFRYVLRNIRDDFAGVADFPYVNDRRVYQFAHHRGDVILGNVGAPEQDMQVRLTVFSLFSHSEILDLSVRVQAADALDAETPCVSEEPEPVGWVLADPRINGECQEAVRCPACGLRHELRPALWTAVVAAPRPADE
jgi:hypothetical protein